MLVNVQDIALDQWSCPAYDQIQEHLVVSDLVFGDGSVDLRIEFALVTPYHCSADGERVGSAFSYRC
ncbi:protein of unknown function [Agrobacterium pusense]|uniref:Uncharacterized protein n=1 Tax=Agrobacterium pusense TaxID=648995 RepID=U4Q5X4_9HYPH|nr:protein of unknown function [Agrobacterium pusense]